MQWRDKYTEVELINKGSFGTVFAVRRKETGEEFALKEFHQHELMDDVMVERFHREVIAMSSLSHPSIVPIIDYETNIGGVPYYVMPRYVCSLSDVMSNGLAKRPTVKQVVSPILEALKAVHSALLAHRDIQPKNIMYDGNRFILGDFSLVRLAGIDSYLSKGRTLGGVAGYAAPEQLVSGQEVDHRADIFAIGSLILYLETGKNPLQIQIEDVSSPFKRVAQTCRASSPDLRYQTIEELEEVLEKIWNWEKTWEVRDFVKNNRIRPPSIGDHEGLLSTLLVCSNTEWFHVVEYLLNCSALDLTHLMSLPGFGVLLEQIGEQASKPTKVFHHLDPLGNLLVRISEVTTDASIIINCGRICLLVGCRHDQFSFRRDFGKIKHQMDMKCESVADWDAMLIAMPNEVAWVEDSRTLRKRKRR